MKNTALRLLAGVAFITAISSVALAQQPAAPAPVPEQMPFDIPYGTPIGLEQAKHVLAAAEAEAKKHNWKMNIAVVGPAGGLVFFEKMDGAPLPPLPVSHDHAHTAATLRPPTEAVFAPVLGGHVLITFLPLVVLPTARLP